MKDLITSIVGWNQSGYLDSGAWDHIRSKIDGVAYPSNIEALRLTPHHGSPLPLQLAFMVNTYVIQHFIVVFRDMSLFLVETF